MLAFTINIEYELARSTWALRSLWATSDIATVKLADKGFSMAGRLLIPDRGSGSKEEVVSVNLSPLHELLDQYDTNFDVDSIVSGTALECLVSAAKEAARATIDAAIVKR